MALKLILPEFAQDPTFQQLFVNEARIGSQLQHQNLVGIQDFDREEHHFFLVMEYVEGITLRRSSPSWDARWRMDCSTLTTLATSKGSSCIWFTATSSPAT